MAGSACRLAWIGRCRRALLSVIFALLGTVALDRLWGALLEERARLILLALWTLSPCLLLYARMCRSYTSAGALCAFWRWRCCRASLEKSTRRNAVLLALALLGALYTHYAAGIALIATANLVLLVSPAVADALRARLRDRDRLPSLDLAAWRRRWVRGAPTRAATR